MRQTVAYVFPGQGSQTIGMGQALFNNNTEAKLTFTEAEDVLGFKVSSLCFEGPKDALDDTLNAQPALLTTSIATLRAIRAHQGIQPPAFVAGHSMGEYSALVASGALNFSDGLRLVRERGRLMKKAGEQKPGAMAAILGLDTEPVAKICTQTAGVQIANDNAPGQIVISGSMAGIEKAMASATEAGARKVVQLAVSIAAHSTLMTTIVDEFKQTILAAKINPPKVPIISNITARPLETSSDVQNELIQQLTAPVHWVDSVKYMISQGTKVFVEIGPGDVLMGLIRRIDRGTQRIPISNAGDIENLKQILA